MRGVTSYRHPLSTFSKFQLTRLMRGVTGLKHPLPPEKCPFQLTRLMRGVTLLMAARVQAFRNFNSHASCEA